MDKAPKPARRGIRRAVYVTVNSMAGPVTPENIYKSLQREHLTARVKNTVTLAQVTSACEKMVLFGYLIRPKPNHYQIASRGYWNSRLPYRLKVRADALEHSRNSRLKQRVAAQTAATTVEEPVSDAPTVKLAPFPSKSRSATAAVYTALMQMPNRRGKVDDVIRYLRKHRDEYLIDGALGWSRVNTWMCSMYNYGYLERAGNEWWVASHETFKSCEPYRRRRSGKPREPAPVVVSPVSTRADDERTVRRLAFLSGVAIGVGVCGVVVMVAATILGG